MVASQNITGHKTMNVNRFMCVNDA